jgi:hypothetical protein
MSNQEHPVETISLFIRLRDLERSGHLTSQPVFEPGFGGGSAFCFEGRPLNFKMGYVGDTEGLKTQTGSLMVFDRPVDLAYDRETLTLIAVAPAQ